MTEPEKKQTRQEPTHDVALFHSLIVSLSATALAYMGKSVTPEGEKVKANLPVAQHTIDTIEMLKTRTSGNLSPEEAEFLDEMLYQLRLAYVGATEGKDKPAEPAPEPKQPDQPKPPKDTGR